MADNVNVTAGTGTVVATDQCGVDHYQKIKITDGLADSTVMIGAGGGVEATALRVTIANDSTGVVSVDDGGGALTVDGTVAVTNAPLTSIDGKMVSGTDIGDVTINNAAGAAAVNIQDGGNAITVDGTITAELSATDNAVLDTIDTAIDAINAKLVAGTVIGDVNLGVTDNAVLDVIAAKDFATQTTLAALNAKLVTGTVIGDVNLGATDNAVLDTIDAVLDAINAKLVTGTDIGDITINNAAGAAAVNIQDGGNAITIDGTVTASNTAGDIASDSADSGNPVKVGGKAVNMDGTTPGTAVAEADRTDFITDLYGRQLVDTVHPCFWSASAAYTSAQTAVEVVATPGAGLSLYITDVIISNGATAGNIKLGEDTAALVDKIEIMYFVSNGGAALHFRTPIKFTANKNFGLTSVLCTTHSITVCGYTAP